MLVDIQMKTAVIVSCLHFLWEYEHDEDEDDHIDNDDHLQ